MSATLEFEVLTIFPAAVEAFVSAGIMGKAIERGLVAVHCTNPRDFTDDRHRTVDDSPFGGGAGMVIKAEPVAAALDAVVAARGPVHRILLTPSGDRFDQRAAERLARLDRVALLCGRYEGIDDRIREHYVDECLSIGDFVLNGGEVAAAVIIEAVARLREGVLGNPESIELESFAGEGGAPAPGDWTPGLVLEHPHYTRPAVFRGHAVPPVLLGGNHQAVERWRRRAACLRTWALRPALRPHFRLGSWPEIWLAVPAELDPEQAAELAELAKSAGMGLASVGGRLEGAKLHMRDLKAVAKFLRKRHRRDPWVLGVGEAEDEAPILGPRLVLDVLAYESGEPPAPLILWLGPGDHPGLGARAPVAWLALDAAEEPVCGGQQKSSGARLALASGLIDISQPQAARRPVVPLARLTLEALRRDGLLGQEFS